MAVSSDIIGNLSGESNTQFVILNSAKWLKFDALFAVWTAFPSMPARKVLLMGLRAKLRFGTDRALAFGHVA
jgi:hypothetical protein